MGERIQRQPALGTGRRIAQTISHPRVTELMHGDANDKRQEQTEKYRRVS